MDNPEGQVTYPIRNRTAGLPTSSSTFLGVHCVFIFVFIIKPYGTINLIRQIQIHAYFQSLHKTGIYLFLYVTTIPTTEAKKAIGASLTNKNSTPCIIVPATANSGSL